MKRATSIASQRKNANPTAADARTVGSQTLFRGLDVLEAVADGVTELADLAAHLGLTRSTTYRLAAALVERHYLRFTPRSGYGLGHKLLELGSAAHRQTDLVQIARPVLAELSARTSDTVHLGILEDDRALYLDKIAGRRRVEVSSRVGERQPLSSTGLGKALLLDGTPEQWRDIYRSETGNTGNAKRLAGWVRRMQDYASRGYAFDLEENEDQIRCVAAPIRDASGYIVGAISLSSATQYMDDARMDALSTDVREAAEEISGALGWNGSRPAGKKTG